MDGPLKWHGGKHYFAKKFIELMPQHVHYVEPFFGGGAVLLEKNPVGVSEVVNDLNFELTNFWSVLKDQDQFEQFQRAMEATPFSEVEFVESDADDDVPNPRANWSQLENAIAFFVRCRQSRAGCFKDFATLSRTRTRRKMNEQASAWLTCIEGLSAVHARLQRVVILNRPASKVIEQQDGPNTLFYLDPPYLHATRSTTGQYAHEMTDLQHAKLLGQLATIGGKFMLSGFRSPLYDDAAEMYGWTRKDFDAPNNASGGKEKRRMVESVWMNFKP